MLILPGTGNGPATPHTLYSTKNHRLVDAGTVNIAAIAVIANIDIVYLHNRYVARGARYIHCFVLYKDDNLEATVLKKMLLVIISSIDSVIQMR